MHPARKILVPFQTEPGCLAPAVLALIKPGQREERKIEKSEVCLLLLPSLVWVLSLILSGEPPQDGSLERPAYLLLPPSLPPSHTHMQPQEK